MHSYTLGLLKNFAVLQQTSLIVSEVSEVESVKVGKGNPPDLDARVQVIVGSAEEADLSWLLNSGHCKPTPPHVCAVLMAGEPPKENQQAQHRVAIAGDMESQNMDDFTAREDSNYFQSFQLLQDGQDNAGCQPLMSALPSVRQFLQRWIAN